VVEVIAAEPEIRVLLAMFGPAGAGLGSVRDLASSEDADPPTFPQRRKPSFPIKVSLEGTWLTYR
jgi:hypothetical protein